VATRAANRFNRWLKRYREAFDFIGKVIVGVAALWVSFAAYLVSRQQLYLSELGIEPIFSIEFYIERDKADGALNSTNIEIRNVGAPVYNYQVRLESWIVEIPLWPTDRTVEPPVPLFGFFKTDDESSRANGLIYRATGDQNLKKIRSLSTMSSIFDSVKFNQFLPVQVQHTIKITYTNRVGVIRHEYFIDRLKVEEIIYNELLNGRRLALELSCYVFLDNGTPEIIRSFRNRINSKEKCR
jgi:hypothetical protein